MIPMEAVSYFMFVAYLISFFGLTAMNAKLAGKSVWLFDKGKDKQHLPAWLFRFAFAGSAIWPLLRASGFEPWPDDPVRQILDGVAGDLVGHLLIVVGACIAIISQMHMGASWRIGADQGEVGDIIDNGPFAFSRNPVFVGQITLFAGLFLVFPGTFQGALTGALLTAIVLQVRIEERVLEATLGEPYIAYTLRVSRWLGGKTA